VGPVPSPRIPPLCGDVGHDGVNLGTAGRSRRPSQTLEVTGSEGALRLLIEPAQLFTMVREVLGERLVDHLGTAAAHELRELREGAIVVGGEQSVDIIANLQSFNNRADKIDARGGSISSA